MRGLGRVLDRREEIEEIIESEHKRVLPKLAEYREKLKGKTAYITAGAAHGHAIIALLKELGIEVQGAAIFHHDPVYDNGDINSDVLSSTVKNYGDVKHYNVCNKQAYELVNILNRLKPDILIARHGGMVIWGAKLGIPTFLMEDEQFGFGYQGILNYAEKVLETFDNIEFTLNLAKHSTMPYTDLILGSSWESSLAKEIKADLLILSVPITYRLVLTCGYVGYNGGLRVAEDIYDRVLDTYR